MISKLFGCRRVEIVLQQPDFSTRLLLKTWSTMTSSFSLKNCRPHESLPPKMIWKQGPSYPLTYASHVGCVFLCVWMCVSTVSTAFRASSPGRPRYGSWTLPGRVGGPLPWGRPPSGGRVRTGGSGVRPGSCPSLDPPARVCCWSLHRYPPWPHQWTNLAFLLSILEWSLLLLKLE